MFVDSNSIAFYSRTNCVFSMDRNGILTINTKVFMVNGILTINT